MPLLSVGHMLVSDAPEARQDTQDAGNERHIVCRLVANQALVATALTARLHLRVRVVHSSVEQIVDVSAYDTCQGHDAPIDGESVRPKRIDDEGWEHAK